MEAGGALCLMATESFNRETCKPREEEKRKRKLAFFSRRMGSAESGGVFKRLIPWTD
jgi:hypothetical protein